MTKKIAIYNDEGVGAFSLFSTSHYFKAHAPILISAADIKNGVLTTEIDLFVIPGGADIPYQQKLEGNGNEAIKNYVENGGTYLGICAGAYYGCSNIEFQKGSTHEICADRDLNFFAGTALGCLPSLTSNLYNEKLDSATVTTISMNDKNYSTLYWGGCYFSGSLSPQEQIGCYSEVENKPAIISTHINKGKAILSGVHFEVAAESLRAFDFQNGKENQIAKELAETMETNSPLLGSLMKEYLDV